MVISLQISRPKTTMDHIRFHEWIGNSWAALFSHPKEFTPVCTTEPVTCQLKPEFDKRHTRIIGLASMASEPCEVVEGYRGDARPRAELSDDWRHRSQGCPSCTGCCPPAWKATCDGRTPADIKRGATSSWSARTRRFKLIIVYPMTTGRNFDEVLRVITSLQLTAQHKVSTPVNGSQVTM